MANFSMATKLEVVPVGNGRFSVLPRGEPAGPGQEGEFETRAEAEEWLFRRTQDAARDTDMGLLTPGGGQGIR